MADKLNDCSDLNVQELLPTLLNLKKEEKQQTWKDLVKCTINGSKRACFEFLEPTDYGV